MRRRSELSAEKNNSDNSSAQRAVSVALKASERAAIPGLAMSGLATLDLTVAGSPVSQ
jgi:hypothetical protein